MTPAKELPIVIEKSQEDIDQIIVLVHSPQLEESFKKRKKPVGSSWRMKRTSKLMANGSTFIVQ